MHPNCNAFYSPHRTFRPIFWDDNNWLSSENYYFFNFRDIKNGVPKGTTFRQFMECIRSDPAYIICYNKRGYECSSTQNNQWLIPEWITASHYALWPFRTFIENDFNYYFDSVNRHSDHFWHNINYLSMLLHKPPMYKSKRINFFYDLSHNEQILAYKKTENLLRNDKVTFALLHFEQFIKFSTDKHNLNFNHY